MQRRVSLQQRIARSRVAWREFGPLRPVAVVVAVVPTVGLWVALFARDALRVEMAGGGAGAFALTALVTAFATGCVLLPPSVAALVLGYALGPAAGAGSAVLGVALGGVLAQRLVWPPFGRWLFPFIRRRPRFAAAQRLTGPGWSRATRGTAALRASGTFPFAVSNLLLAAVGPPASAVLVGGALAAAPLALVAAQLGDAWRVYRDTRALPEAPGIAALAASVALFAWATRRARQAWRACQAAT